VADIHANNISPEELALQSVHLLALYNRPLWAIEDNDWGVLTLRKAQEMGYKNLFCQDWVKDRSKSSKPGWHTGDRTKRFLIWGELIELVNARELLVPSKRGLEQFFTVIRNPDKDGRIEGLEGTHDDYPMACAIAWEMRKYARFGSLNIEQKLF
jgi:hypothetical protein